MSARFVSADGHTVVDVIRLCLPEGGTSERFRVRRYGFIEGEARTVPELAELVDPH